MSDGRTKRKGGKPLRKRHEYFRNRVFTLLTYEDRWMTGREIWSAFFDGHPATLTVRTNGCAPMIPNVRNGAIMTVLRRDGRFKYRYVDPTVGNLHRYRKEQEFKVDENAVED